MLANRHPERCAGKFIAGKAGSYENQPPHRARDAPTKTNHPIGAGDASCENLRRLYRCPNA